MDTSTNERHDLTLHGSNKKTALAAYIYVLLLGCLGAHSFYLGRKRSGLTILGLLALGLLTTPISGIGLIFLALIAIWNLADIFLIPGWIRRHNAQLATPV